jgi:hypothetical protein
LQWDKSVELKTHEMHHDNYENCILSEFPPQFHSLKPLAEELRQILFPIVDGQLWTGTDSSLSGTNCMYDGFIAAFERAIVREEALKNNLSRD